MLASYAIPMICSFHIVEPNVDSTSLAKDSGSSSSQVATRSSMGCRMPASVIPAFRNPSKRITSGSGSPASCIRSNCSNVSSEGMMSTLTVMLGCSASKSSKLGVPSSWVNQTVNSTGSSDAPAAVVSEPDAAVVCRVVSRAPEPPWCPSRCLGRMLQGPPSRLIRAKIRLLAPSACCFMIHSFPSSGFASTTGLTHRDPAIEMPLAARKSRRAGDGSTNRPLAADAVLTPTYAINTTAGAVSLRLTMQ